MASEPVVTLPCGRVGGVDLDELLEDFAGFGAIGAGGGNDSGLGNGCRGEDGKAENQSNGDGAKAPLMIETHERIVSSGLRWPLAMRR